MALNQEKVKDNRFSEVVEDKKLNTSNSFYQFLEIITFLLIILGLTIVSFYNYLLYHSIVEIFSIVIACVIFIIALTMQKEIDNNFFLILGISSFFVGIIDLLHMLAYKGMGVFLEYDANLPTQLWIAARYLQAFSILYSSLMMNKKKIKILSLFFGYLLITSSLIILIFLRFFPDCYIEGSGLTPCKIISEYVIIFIIILAILNLYKKKDEFEKNIFNLLIASFLSIIIAEFAFTFYVNVYGISNLIGHIFKIIAFYLIYKAMIQIGLKNPEQLLFRKLNLSEKKYHEAYNLSNFYKDIFTHDISNIIQIINSSVEIWNLTKKERNNIKDFEEVIEEIEIQTKRGINLITNIRKLSELEKTEIILEKTDVFKTLDISLRNIQKSYHNKNLKIKLRNHLNKNLYIDANPLLNDVFENIMVNSIQYNENAQIEVNIIISQTKENNRNCVKIEFLDNGIGIQDFKKQTIFKRGGSKQKGGKGMGIGLSLVKMIVDSYNGRIWVEDRIKGDHSKGSNFILMFPEIT